MSNNKDEKKPELSEAEQYQAYLELCNIIRTAIETQDFSIIEPSIAIWENKYPIDKFTNLDIIMKIKAILNKDYLSRLIGDYLASKVLREQQRQKEYYDDLKNIIETAKKTKDYQTAKKEVAKWKTSLYESGFSIYDFNKIYSKQIFKMLLLPSKELLTQKEAFEELKKLYYDSQEMNSEELSNRISSWQNKYSLEHFPDDIREELNSIAADVLKSVSTKKSEETALQEIQEYVSSGNMVSPVKEIPELLVKYDFANFSDCTKFQINSLTLDAISLTELTITSSELESDITVAFEYMPPVQKEAIYDLKNIFSKNTHDLEGLFNWIYLNRKVDFVPEAIDEIKALFSMAGFPKPPHGEYAIPSLGTDIRSLSLKDISKVREQVVLNYLGILYMDNKSLSTAEKDSISDIRDKHEVLSVAQSGVKPQSAIVLSALDNDVLSKPQEVLYEDSEEINILIEDILKDPLESYEISSPKFLDSGPQDEFEPFLSEGTGTESNSGRDTLSAPTSERNPEHEEEASCTEHLLPEKDQKAIEDINYLFTTYNILHVSLQKEEDKGKYDKIGSIPETSYFPI